MKITIIALAVSLFINGALAETTLIKVPPAVSQIALMNVPLDVTDLDRAIAFYTKGLGLTVGPRINRPDVIELPVAFPAGTAGLNLVLVKNPSDKTRPITPGRVTLAVPDVAALGAQLEAAGYHLHGPIVEVAQFHVQVAHVLDPDGNDLELVQLPR